MTARGSDFVNARCRRGAQFVRFSSMNHWSLHQITCSGFLLGPDPMDVISNIQAIGIGCGVADTVIGASRNPGASFDVFTDYRASGFQCHGTFVIPPGGAEGHIHFVCTTGGSSIRFDHR
jgi:hypothetical protein